jgi:hypothetical protein
VPGIRYVAGVEEELDRARERCVAWIDRAVVGHGLCPFARAPFEAGRVRVVVTGAATAEGVYDALDAEIEALLGADPREVETTLLVCPRCCPEDFEAFLEVVSVAEAAVAERGLEGVLQIASFHPRYRFGDAPVDDPGHWTNRAPYPVLHLLREDSVEAAVAEHPDPDAIWKRNVAKLRAMTARERERLRDG